jgi:hypothetical protein
MSKKEADYLFLDDYRHPYDCFQLSQNPIYLQEKWTIVRNYNQFVNWITKNGMPKLISFDHDLASSHYTPEYLWTDYEKSKAWQDAQVHTEKTGYDCAWWLVNNCEKLPLFLCHSQNPVGRDKITKLLNEFTKS